MIKCLTKVAQKIGAFWGYLENIAILVKNYLGYFLCIFSKKLSNF